MLYVLYRVAKSKYWPKIKRTANMLYYLNADLSALDSRWENWLNNQKFKNTADSKLSLVPDSGIEVGKKSLKLVWINKTANQQGTRDIDLKT